MSAAAVVAEECAEGYRESLTERMARGPMPAGETFRYAIQVATCLRDLHSQGLVYGAVSSQLIVLGPSGASLRLSGLAQLGDARMDVKAFGGVLQEMLRRAEGNGWREELDALALRCQSETPDIQQVLITLRLLAMRIRQESYVPRPLFVVEPPVSAASRVRLRIQMALQWKPLASLVAFAISGR